MIVSSFKLLFVIIAIGEVEFSGWLLRLWEWWWQQGREGKV